MNLRDAVPTTYTLAVCGVGAMVFVLLPDYLPHHAGPLPAQDASFKDRILLQVPALVSGLAGAVTLAAAVFLLERRHLLDAWTTIRQSRAKKDQ
jgi:hypothetical protein